jgi:hypothetical protein
MAFKFLLPFKYGARTPKNTTLLIPFALARNDYILNSIVYPDLFAYFFIIFIPVSTDILERVAYYYYAVYFRMSI